METLAPQVHDRFDRPWDGDRKALLHFYSPPADGSAPRFVVKHASGAGEKNYGYDRRNITIRDMRGCEAQFNLGRHSFATLSNTPRLPLRPNNSAAAASTDDSSSTMQQCRALVEGMVMRAIPEAAKVVIFDTTVRRAGSGKDLNGPVFKVHVDQSPLGALQRARRYCTPAEVELIAQGKLRMRIVNVWQPLVDTVTDHPLAVAESDSVVEDDLVRVSHIYPDDVVGETYAVKFGGEQRFWYWSNMTSEEALLFQCFDSLSDGVGQTQRGPIPGARCAHASFTLQEPSLERNDRESLEARCLVLG